MNNPSRQLIILQPGDDRKIIYGAGDEYRYYATGKETDGRYFFFEGVIPPGGGPPPHIQTREDEAFLILEGELVFHVDGKRTIAKPGTYLNVPPHVLHSFKNESDQTARLIFFFAPAGIEGLFDELGAINEDPNTPDADMDAVRKIGKKYGVEFP